MGNLPCEVVKPIRKRHSQNVFSHNYTMCEEKCDGPESTPFGVLNQDLNGLVHDHAIRDDKNSGELFEPGDN